MKDFLPVFMSSYVSDYISCRGHWGLWWTSVCLAAERPGDGVRGKKRCSPVNVPPSPSPSSLSQWLLLQLWSEKLFDSQANNFPRSTSLFPLPLLPLIALPAPREKSWNQISVTHLLLLLYAPLAPPPSLPPRHLHPHLFFYPPGERRTQQKQVSGYGSREHGSPAGGEAGLHDSGTTWGTQAAAAASLRSEAAVTLNYDLIALAAQKSELQSYFIWFT